MSYNRLGSIYKTHIGVNQAIQYLRDALKLNIELDIPNRQCENYINLGHAYLQQSKYNEALTEVKKGVQIADNLNDKALMKDANELLSLLYASKKQYREAYIAQQKYESLSDSLEENKKRYWIENTAKNRLIGEATHFKTIKRLRFWAVFWGIIALLLVSLNVYFYRSLIYARKEVAERDRLLETKENDYQELKAILKKVVEK
jgi:tetratricopeptide (TPR) repeat protein